MLLYDIDENAEIYSFSRAVDYMNMSEAYFSRFFKRISGMTFSMYLNHIRVNRAIDLIKNTDLSMTEIAMKCGFETIRNFNRVFRQVTGYAPRELPDGYVLNLRSNSGNVSNFDPTIKTSELMNE
jgi:xylan 1,4-beta-xylosidase